ncbi:hypothetical protein Rahaq_3584 [Rahnella aceris]|uniref:Right handed beta helix domain-containing protein n=1 Tax=Rahnella sp. (strain Y9602) TaxID=2703885 RepID=A0A0H3FJM4_RAHSY|nr:right-handed parallel beta-helix repeat-containing protein [Rahnella aceris]ADW75175.1 hypothetical protein Rahaq_3584 [Rahnella aceris]
MKKFTRRDFLSSLAVCSMASIIPARIAYGKPLGQEQLLSLDINEGGVDRNGSIVLVKKPLILHAGHYSNITFYPDAGYFGPGPIFMARNGKVIHNNITVSGFSGPGCKILSDSEIGNSFIALGKCNYSNNGDLRRTTLTSSANMRFSPSIFVADSSLFKPGDFIWIGDGKFKIREIKGSEILLVTGVPPNIISPMVFSGGYDKCTVGQFVTMNGDDKHGIRIGNGGYGWDIDLSQSKIESSHNSGAGFYHACKKFNGKQIIENITSIGNGYINIGMSYMREGVIKNCIARDSGNNGIDVFATSKKVDIHDNIVSGAGVDGIFIGGDGESARVYDNKISNCRRVGILINARLNPIKEVFVKGNMILNSGMNSLTLTGVESGAVNENNLNGSVKRPTIYLERRNGLALSGILNISDNTILNSSSGDIGTNYPGYSNTSEATVQIKSARKLDVSGIKGY